MWINNKPRLRCQPNTTTTVIVVAIVINIGCIIAVWQADVDGIIIPRAAAEADTLYCLPFDNSVAWELLLLTHLTNFFLFIHIIVDMIMAAGLKKAAMQTHP